MINAGDRKTGTDADISVNTRWGNSKKKKKMFTFKDNYPFLLIN